MASWFFFDRIKSLNNVSSLCAKRFDRMKKFSFQAKINTRKRSSKLILRAVNNLIPPLYEVRRAFSPRFASFTKIKLFVQQEKQAFNEHFCPNIYPTINISHSLPRRSLPELYIFKTNWVVKISSKKLSSTSLKTREREKIERNDSTNPPSRQERKKERKKNCWNELHWASSNPSWV